MNRADVGSRSVEREELETLHAFTGVMITKLRENRHKGGWKDEDPQALLGRLHNEVSELQRALEEYLTAASINHIEKDVYAEQVQRECADVANFAMFIADVVNRLKRPTTPPPPCESPAVPR